MEKNRDVFSRILMVIVVTFGILFSTLSPSSAAQASFSIKDYFSGSVATSVRYGANDCVNVPVKYKASRYLGYPTHVITLSITSKLGGTGGVGLTSLELNKRDKYSATANVKLCRVTGYKSIDGFKIRPTKPGTYYFQASLMQIKPFLMFESKVIKITLTN